MDDDTGGEAVRVVSVEKGAFGTARISAAGGLSFYVRADALEALRGDPSFPAPGQVLDEAWRDAIVRADEASRAAYKGLELLARAEHTRFLLSRKLAARDFSAAAVALALDLLEAEGALSAERYAEAWVRSRLARGGKGPAELLSGLLARGVSGELARSTLARLFGPSERALAIRALYSGKLARLEDAARRSKLRATGFGAAEIREALEEREGES
ncbi:MAG: RecX family transcriptional regulator [Spirochaetales bacterium]|nr:RecX family transcriptional regulator [Spirochaetales bacterium]